MPVNQQGRTARPGGPRAVKAALLLGAALWPLATAAAETAGPAPSAALAQAAPAAPAAAVAFDIPAQPVAQALVQFKEQSGLQLAYSTDDVRGLQSQGVNGDYSPEQALHLLLAGTDLTYRFTNADTVTLEKAADGGTTMLDPLVVTGEKVERSYLQTYSSVGIATEEDIDVYNADDLYDTFNNMANVRAFPHAEGNNGFEIRGMNADGVTQPANSAPLISVIIDGVTQSAEGLKRGSRGIWDVEQVEVLRGPQSTLQGRNALAGAVVVKTKDPTWVPEFDAKAGVGNLDRKEVAVAASAPIIEDQLAFRVSGEYSAKTSDIDFADPANETLADDEYTNLRGKLLFMPEFAEGFRLLLTASRAYDKPTAGSVTGPDFFDREYNTTSDFIEFREMDVLNYNADVSYAFDNGMVLRSITAINDTDLNINSAPASPVFFRNDNREDFDITEDLRLEINDEIFGLSGVIGVFYGDFDQKVDTRIDAYGAVFQEGDIRNQTETLAAYADLRYRFLEDFVLIAGGRFQHDKVRNLVDTDSDYTGPSFSDMEASFDVFLPKIGLGYDISPTQSVAVTAARGYRQGFTEILVGTGDQVNAVDPEFMWTYELAYRLETSGNRLQLGANLFFNDYTDHQITVTDPVFAPLSNTRNAADSISYGAEVEGRYNFGNGLQVFGSLGLLKTEFGDFPDAECEPSGGNCEGNSFPEAPAVTGALGGVYRHDSGFYGAVSANYTDDYYVRGDVNNMAEVEIESRILANAKIGYAGEHFGFSLYVDNIFDKDYLTGRSTSGNTATIGDGRTVGVEARLRF
ncbi:MAG: TonB-dependent receptor [Kiloniellaceae bacterium]